MRLLHLLSFLITVGSVGVSPTANAQPDTISAKTSKQTKPTSRLAPSPMTMPGTRLDTNFRTIPAQSSAVGKGAPAWLRAKATGSPMYIVNGKTATAVQLKALRQQDVASVKVLEGSRAVTFYGKNARNGMVIITMKSRIAHKK